MSGPDWYLVADFSPVRFQILAENRIWGNNFQIFEKYTF